MKNTTVTIITSILLLFTSCKKNIKDGPTYTISGHLYEDCNMQPVANTFMDLLYGGSGFLTSTTTDANGYFKLEFKHGYSDFQKIRIKSGTGYSEIMINIPWLTNIDSLVLYKNPLTTIKMNLNVINSYTPNDTLFITNFNDIFNKLKVIGPFTNGLLYTTDNFPLLIMEYPNNPISIGYKINNANYTLQTVIFTACDTMNITVDIN